MRTSSDPQFNQYYQLHCKHLRLKGLQPKTIDAYTRAIRRIGDYFDFQIDNLSQNRGEKVGSRYVGYEYRPGPSSA